MKKNIGSALLAIAISFPFVFVLFFFGYFPVQYDIVLQTDRIVGEGICQTYVCPSVAYAAFYEVPFYFGSKLKKTTIQGYHYDVTQIEFVISDVSAFDITGLDSYIKGIHLAHYDPTDILPDGEEVEGSKARLVSRDGKLHVDVFDPNMGATLTISEPFIPARFWAAYFTVFLLLTALVAFVIRVILQRIPVLKIPLLSAACIVVTMLAGCYFCGSLPYVIYTNFLLNWLFLFALALLLNAVTLPFLGTMLTMTFTTFWYAANYFVIMLRSKPIMPADLKAIGTAKEVMDGYSFTPNRQMVLGIVVVIIYAAILAYVWKKNKTTEEQSIKKQLLWRGVSATMAALSMVIGINTNTFKNLDSFAWDMVLLKSFHEEGMVTTYLKSAYNSVVREPDGYSRELVNNYLADFQNTQKTDGIRPTNIIMVMNEAFSDLRSVGLSSNIDVMPFVDSLDENTIEGSLYVSVFGGGTCNTEFEALTGNTMALLGPGAYPYTENITKPLFSLASYFKKNGYLTEAFHANNAMNWNRNIVYPNLGFDAFHSIEDFEAFREVTYLHEHPADISDYLYMEALDEQKSAHPRFLFDVTMQNHSGYERWLDVERDASVAAFGSDLYVDTQIYLSLLKASDDELRQLIETYKKSAEPTMIIFFGDHQPSLPTYAQSEIYKEMESYLDWYKSKFFIWTNYETEERHGASLSANYLPYLILERGNFDLPPFVQMLKAVHEKYPVISSQGVIDAEGNMYSNITELADDPLIQKYQNIQYANLFDEIDTAWFEVK